MAAPDFDASLRQAYARLGRLYDAERWAEAGAVCEEMLRHQPDHFDALYLGGLIAYRTGRKAAARSLVEKACRVAPGVRRFNHMTGLLKQRGEGNWLKIQEVRYLQYKKSRLIDGYVISYPKCGRTWIRMMLGRYLIGDGEGDYLDTLEMTHANPRLPTIHFSHDDYPHVKRYTALHEDKSMYEDKSIVFLVRDPRDVVVSYFFQYTKRGDRKTANDASFQGTLADFVRHDIGGVKNIVRFYNIWARNRNVPKRFQLMRYEDIHADPKAAFEKFLDFFRIPRSSAAAIADAVSFASFDNMRRLEETNALNSLRLRPPQDRDPEGYKVRQGAVGGYRDYLSDADVAFIDEYLDSELDGYFRCYLAARATPATGARRRREHGPGTWPDN